MGMAAERENSPSVQPLLAASALPLQVQPGEDHALYLPARLEFARTRLHEVGGLLLRGFDVLGEQDFQQLARSFGHELPSHEFGSTPRKVVKQGVYTFTEYLAHQSI